MDRLGNFLHGHHTSNYAESALGIIKDIILNRLVSMVTLILCCRINSDFDYLNYCESHLTTNQMII